MGNWKKISKWKIWWETIWENLVIGKEFQREKCDIKQRENFVDNWKKIWKSKILCKTIWENFMIAKKFPSQKCYIK